MSVFPCIALLAGVVGTGAASYCSPPHLLLYSESQFFAQLGRKPPVAKPRGDSKLAVAGALTLVLAIAGVLLVKEPLRSSRPVGSGLEMKQTTGEHLVRARLWEDPVAAVERAIREKGSRQGHRRIVLGPTARLSPSCDCRSRP